MNMVDELTGADYKKELSFYVRYHGLSVEQAIEVLAASKSHSERDAVFLRIMSENANRQR